LIHLSSRASTFQADKLRYHRVLHTAEKSFHCDQCEKSFPRVDKLNRHKVSIGLFHVRAVFLNSFSEL
jgi:hypothetical protein